MCPRWERGKSEDLDIQFWGWAIFPEGLFLNFGMVHTFSCTHWGVVCAAVLEQVLTSSTSQWFSKEGMVTSWRVRVSLFFSFSCKKLWHLSFTKFVVLSKNISGGARSKTVYGQLTLFYFAVAFDKSRNIIRATPLYLLFNYFDIIC